jgi:hypothetical protein
VPPRVNAPNIIPSPIGWEKVPEGRMRGLLVLVMVMIILIVMLILEIPEFLILPCVER